MINWKETKIKEKHNIFMMLDSIKECKDNNKDGITKQKNKNLNNQNVYATKKYY
jgi:hypothetical protein